MASRTFASNKSSLFADGSSNLGGGADDHMPVGGPWNGYVFRSAVRFALDFSGMKRIDSAILRLKTSDQVHVGFSSDPDIYVARATADWTANGSSSSGEGGSGWGTSPTVYPGPASTTTNRVSRDVSTSQNATVDIDITGIVRDWLGGAANYGVLLYYVASGDVTEFYSYRHGTSGNRPSIIVTYATDTPPVATMDGPVGVQATTRPTLTGSATDPDGDAVTSYHVEVLQGATVIYAADVAGGPTFAHVPTADLPGGALTARVGASAGGLSSALSNSVSFTVDRPPVVGAFSSPPANGSNRRPPITFATSDPDGNATDAYDIEVYASSGGAPSGGPVYAPTSATSGITAGQVSHVPTVDLPGGNLLVRARVRSGPAALWSAWSGYYPFLVALNSPSIAWVYPSVDRGYVPAYHATGVGDLGTAITAFVPQYRATILPPAGQTLTRIRVWANSGTAPPTTAVDDQPWVPGGGDYAYTVPGLFSPCTFTVKIEATASGGGVATATRTGRFALSEWIGRTFLGDAVSALSGTLVAPGVDQYTWARAEDATGAALSGWGTFADALASMPATNAWLGLRARAVYRVNDVQLLANGGFEQGTTGWIFGDGGNGYAEPASTNPDGSAHRLVLYTAGPGAANYPGCYGQGFARIAIIGGATYAYSGWQTQVGTKRNRATRIEWFDGTGAGGGPGAMIGLDEVVHADPADGIWRFFSKTCVAPATARYAHMRLFVYETGVPFPVESYALWDALSWIGPPGGPDTAVPAGTAPAGGLDRWDLSWTSAG